MGCTCLPCYPTVLRMVCRFTGQRGGGFTGGIKKGRMPLPEQDEVMPKEVASVVQRNEKAMDELPGVLVPQEDGSLEKVGYNK